MQLLTILSLTGVVAARVALWPRGEEDVCKQQPYSDMQNFAYYAPAQSTCWQQYPGPTYTVTVSPTTKTAYTTVTATATSTVHGCPAPGYYPPTTCSESTATTSASQTNNPNPGTTTTTPITPVPTPTATGNVRRNRKRAEQMAAAWGAKWEALHENGEDGCAQTACSCIQGSKTISITSGTGATTTCTIEATTTITTSVC